MSTYLGRDEKAIPLYQGPAPAAAPTASTSRRRTFGVLGAFALLSIFLLRSTNPGFVHWASGSQPARDVGHPHARPHHHDLASTAELCPQVPATVPSKNADVFETLSQLIGTEAFVNKSIDWLSGAVRVPTESYDKMDEVGEDPRWEAFGPFHDYLAEAFPLVHEKLDLVKVNTYGLVYTWKGTSEELKPLLLMAHQDVVPVEPTTVDQWTHPPYSGYFDGSNIWGRGSSDDKSGLIGILTTVETLLSQGFTPTRTITLSFGFDEEVSGTRAFLDQGAGKLASYLLEKFGEDYFAMIVDEGGGYSEQFGGVFASPGIAEKGYLDVRVEIRTPGGHSSIPPEHTSIGALSQLLVKYEANPYTPHLVRGTPLYLLTQCLAAHAPEIPKRLKRAIRKSATCDKALAAAEEELLKDLMFKSLAGTTQAIDLVSGGVKTNALPEQAWAVVNHRIATDSSVDAVKEHDSALLADLADKFNLSYTAFGEKVSTEAEGAPAWGTLTLTDAWGTALEPAPITPTDAAPYKVLSGTIKAAYAAHRGLSYEEDAITIAPGIMTGNTDTRYYWALSKHIFRYNHHRAKGKVLNGVHTVNENIEVDAFMEMIRFFTTLILNVDEAEL
ncbi:carboxypeptidase S [Punctularia strigosozonata HHB-11173 SS5]|uniref:carboxypeptidase S n=1 Tax=Punctularia strigosozonata (strain HHB-11173) TaxID=741275 RepID=UPI0004417373|nr:carboxypeptidase S [Punctularia strigosozonata HHB-11173 SS5]EIN06189.1 carboxypeptidase S [Punctularia strigosozonata HHB-11173 SS5]